MGLRWSPKIIEDDFVSSDLLIFFFDPNHVGLLMKHEC